MCYPSYTNVNAGEISTTAGEGYMGPLLFFATFCESILISKYKDRYQKHLPKLCIQVYLLYILY